MRNPSVLRKKKGEAENEGTSQVVQEGLVGLSSVKPCTQFLFFIVKFFNR